MKSKTTLSELFEHARRGAAVVPLSEIKLLVESGHPSPLAARAAFKPRRILRLFNPLKLLIMTTSIVIITSVFLLLNPVEPKYSEDGGQRTERFTEGRTGIPEGEVVKSKIRDYQGITTETKSLEIPVIVPAKAAAVEPQDTVFEGEILRLTKEELTNLGFTFDEEGYYYLNRLPDGSKMNFWSWQAKPVTQVDSVNSNYRSVYASQLGGSFGFAAGGFVSKNNKSKMNELGFYPVLTTNIFGQDIYPIDQVKDRASAEFELMNDTLVPVLFSFKQLGGYQTEDKLVWFKVTEGFFDLLKSVQSERCRETYLRAKELKTEQLRANLVNYNFLALLPLNNAIRLRPEILKCMGINYSSDAIELNIKAIEYWFNIKLSIVNGGTSMTMKSKLVNPEQVPTDTILPTNESIILLGISDFRNMKMEVMPAHLYRQLKGNNLSFHQYLNLCIPVRVDGTVLDLNLEEVIFWIYPNEHFFDCLPPDIAVPMKKEFEFQAFESLVIVQDMPTFQASQLSQKGIFKDSVPTHPDPVPCVYFTNLCESLPGLDYLNLFPNPATDKLNVELVLLEAKKIWFRVFDLGGREISDGGNSENYSEGGRFTRQIDVSKLQGGLYLLVLTDEEGARVTRRFVKN